ncbi:hypothetical protein GWK47_024076 [Chionoecetes opilio]|uniref:Uncharacterized protein n=1 Tax=Chionoecetes opilio TaxID=41210 RepID=A0A8J4XVR3_CHIOP|nr:hypothetical protein GWK47_024076 [Chionoecetes opilio]
MLGVDYSSHSQVCSKELTSYDPFVAHENGKQHKKVRQKILSVPDPNLQSDLELQHLNKPRGTFTDGSLEDQIDSTKFTVIGVQFVYKEILDGREVYTCQLCHCTDVLQISASRMFSHLTSSTHSKNYLVSLNHNKNYLVSLNHSKNYLKDKFGWSGHKKSTREFEEECCSIEEYEGKIHANIADLTSQFTSSKPGTELPPTWSQRRSLSPSPEDIEDTKTKIPKTEPPEITDISDAKENSVQPPTSDVGVTADLPSEAHYILQEVNAMQEPDCQTILQGDEDMQDLLKELLWVLANKLEKYYIQTGATYNEGKTKTPLTVCAEKAKQYIAEFAGLK